MGWSSLTLLGISLLQEREVLFDVGFDSVVIQVVMVSGIAAFFINWSAFLLIGHTSAVTFELVGQLKTCTLLLAGAVLFAEWPGVRTLAGTSLTISAMVVYTRWNLQDIADRDHKEK